jgi:hypothetical protein
LKLRFRPRILGDEDELDNPPIPQDVSSAAEPRAAPLPIGWLTCIASVAVATRLGYLFFFTNPQNAGEGFTDAYHHWQIAYLTKEVGLAHGLRLWDMRGWEYVWGLLHPFLLNVLFFATGSTDIVVARLLSLVFGSLAVVLIFALCHRYWGLRVAVAAAAFAALSPAAVFNDVAGMAEPIGIALILLGIWLLPRRGFWAGLAWALAAMARGEAWMFTPGLVFAWLLNGRRGSSRAPLVIGWLLGMGFYCKWLLDQTGNPIYPLYVYFQFVGLAAGGTSASASHQLALWIPFVGAALLCGVALLWALRRRPASYLLLIYGFGYSALSLATYLRYETEWKERRFEFPLDFAAILAAVFLIKWLPEHRPQLGSLGRAGAVAALVATQALWVPVQSTYSATEAGYRYVTGLADRIGEVYNRPEYRGGVLNMPGDEPTMLYVMVRDSHLTGDHVTSQFYDPFYYLPADYHYTDHPGVVDSLLQCWLSGTKTRLLLISPPGFLSRTNSEYRAFIAAHPGWFQDTGANLPNGWTLIAASVPALTTSKCTDASRAATR